jgi:superfamily II DNA helicase RecQ
MLPYTQARASMFDDLVRQKTIKPYLFPGKASSDDALVEKIIDKMVPRLKGLIETTIQSALSSHFPLSSHHHDSVLARTTTNRSLYDLSPPCSPSDTEYSQPALALSEDDDTLEYADNPDDYTRSSAPSPPPTSITSSPSPIPTRSSSSSSSYHPFFNTSHSLPSDPILSGLYPACSDLLVKQALVQIGKLLKIEQPSWTCDEQRLAMTKVLEAKGDVLAVMQTSSGKSMLMVIPSLVEENRITIGILPLNSLLTDYRRKLSNQGVPFEYYHTTLSPNLTGQHNLILVTIDQARTQGWKQQLAELNAKIPVCRAVFDEAHFAITNNTFRKVLEDPHDLRAFPTMQMVLLSATIPPKTVSTIQKTFELSANCSIIRTPLRRPELQYILESPYLTAKDITVRVQSILQEASLEPRDRALIFVPYLDQGVVLAEVLKCDFYRGGRCETPEEKEAIYHRWIQGIYKVMVATSAFGAGNDYPHVRLVIHAGQPRNCMDYIQESSRGGRDQQPCQCIILPLHGAKPVETEDEIDHMGIQNMGQMLANTAPSCIRHHLTAYNNGIGITCSQLPQCQPCSQCDLSILPAAPPEPTTKRQFPSDIEMAFQASKRRRIEQTQKKATIYNTLHDALSNFDGICAFCRLYGDHKEKHANIFRCPILHQKAPHLNAFYDLRKKIHYSAIHSNVAICYKCHIPQLDDAFHPTFQRGMDQCRYQDCVFPVALGVYLDAEKRNSAEEYFQCRWGSIEEFATWINSKAGGDHASRLVEMFLWVCHNLL